VATRHLLIGWPVPGATHADHPALTLATRALLERLIADPTLASPGSIFPPLNDIDGVFYLGAQVKPDADLDELKKRVFEKLSEMAKPESWKEGDVDRLRKQLTQMLDTDLEKLALPPRLTKTMALTNLELQRMAMTLAWGDLDIYRKRLEEVTSERIAAAIGTYLTKKAATVVRLQGKKAEE
jgi:predicted Zn-dependent peptidase